VLERLQTAANKGTIALRTAWGSIGNALQETLRPELAALKEAAAKADKPTESEAA
jgi:hypothetical protein